MGSVPGHRGWTPKHLPSALAGSQGPLSHGNNWPTPRPEGVWVGVPLSPAVAGSKLSHPAQAWPCPSELGATLLALTGPHGSEGVPVLLARPEVSQVGAEEGLGIQAASDHPPHPSSLLQEGVLGEEGPS